MGIEITTMTPTERSDLQRALGLEPAVMVRRADLNLQPSYFAALANTGVARMAKLAEAIATVAAGDVIELMNGEFTVADGEPLSSFTAVTGWFVVCRDGASHVYADPEDACDDYLLFDGRRNVVHFGATIYRSGDTAPAAGSAGDSQKAFQAACNSLGTLYPEPSPVMLESGRILRTGDVFIPNGTYYFGGKVYYSPTVVIEGASTNATQLFLLNGVFNSPGDTTEHFVLTCDPPVSADINNLFYTQVKNLTLSCLDPTQNIRASGLSILGGQGTLVINCIITNWAYRNIYGIGCSLIDTWVPNCIRGPAVHLFGGGFIRGGSIEHVNGAGVANPDIPGTVYPAVLLEAGIYEVDAIIGEEISAVAQTVVHCHNVLSANFGTIGMGVLAGTTRSHTLLRITGTSQNVRVAELFGAQDGYFPNDIGTLVNDTSDFSPNGNGTAGSGIATPYLLTAARGTYCQKSGGFAAGLDIPNTFTKATAFGTNADFAIGIEILSSLGSIYLVGGGYSTTRAASYFNYNNPVPHDWNAGAMTLTTSGIVNVTGEYRVDGVKVLGNQGAAVADPTGGATVDTECRAALATLLSRLRTHGSIAT